MYLPNSYNGTFEKSYGGTEIVYRYLMGKLPIELKNSFQIICSRFREIDPDKIPIFWLHESSKDIESQILLNPFIKRQFKKLVFVSDWQFRTYQQDLGVLPQEGVVLKNAIEPLTVLEKPGDRINLIYHTTPHRGLEILIPVFCHLAKTNSKLHLDVFSSFKAYGLDEMDRHYKSIFDICQNHPQIKYHGYQPNEVVREALQRAHIFTYPCIWAETSCLAAIEAMSAKCLVVCSDLAALSETVGKFGITYAHEKDLNRHANIFGEKLSEAINSLYKESIKELINSSKERADKIYNWKSRIEDWKSLLYGILDES